MGLMALEQFRLDVVATKRGFYGDRMHFEVGSKINPNRAGIPFCLRADALKYDKEGKMHVTKDMKPVLPSWVVPVAGAQVPEIDPKAIEHVVVDPTKAKKGKRKVPAAVKAVAPLAWPKNQKRRNEGDPDRPIKIKRAGTGQFGAGQDDEDDDSEG